MNAHAPLPPARNGTAPKMPGLYRFPPRMPDQNMRAFAKWSAPIWADTMARRIKSAFGSETPDEIEALIIRGVK